MEGLRLNGAFQMQVQFGFREIEDKLFKIAIRLAGDGVAPGKSASTSLFDIINVP
jgi:hypothetical protein